MLDDLFLHGLVTRFQDHHRFDSLPPFDKLLEKLEAILFK
jgi:hypothetical protein